ncbi:class I adenylate-forming enzyme family protein [Peterkaempfera bronchialis]|uniref:class I adenylate-forming enzyme family protein n=1 Tax=Peterkaempfera bronchialis TaxID=2126346 RepID=UPI003C2F0730
MRTWSSEMVAVLRGSGRLAVIDGDRAIDGARLLAAAAGAVSWIESLGLPPEAPLPALVTTNIDTVALLLAGAATGHPLSPLGPRLTAAELGHPVRALGSDVLLYEPAFAATAAEIARTAGIRPVPITPWPEGGGVERLAVTDPESVCVNLHTAGTTGLPKRVPITQGVLWERRRLLAGLTGLGPGAVYATGSPVHHIGGLGTLLVALSVGATAVATRSFSLDWWRSLGPANVTHTLLVPSMIEMLLAADALHALPLRTLIYGASPIHPDTLRRVLAVLPETRLLNLFGQTEGSPLTCLTPEDHLEAARGRPELLTSVGRPVPGLRLRIDNPDAAGAGELLARAPHLSLTGPDGWLRTGDIGHRTKDGYVYLVGRTHDRIVRGGENIFPLEVEQVLESHHAVAAAGVVGVPDRRLGQTVAAFVVPARADRPPDAGELRRYVRERLAGFKVPEYWYVEASLPHSGAGKLLRRELQDLHRERTTEV